MEPSSIIWEIERHNWNALSAFDDPGPVPDALLKLLIASSDVIAREAYRKLDNRVVLQGGICEISLATLQCLTALLPACSAEARPFVLGLMLDIGGLKHYLEDTDYIESEKDSSLRMKCHREILHSYGFLLHYLQNGTPEEQDLCISLLATCVDQVPALREQVLWHLNKYLDIHGKDYALMEYIEELSKS